MESPEAFEQAINRLRDEIASIKTNHKVVEDLNPKYDFIIAKAQELINLLEDNKTRPGVVRALEGVGHVPQHLTLMRSLSKEYIWLERSLNSQIETLKELLCDPFYRRWHLNIFDKTTTQIRD